MWDMSKSKKWLEEHNISFEAIHISENPPTQKELEELYKKVLRVKEVFQHFRAKIS